MPKSSKSDKPFQFEKALASLEKIVEKMDAGDIPLEESLTHFEKGIALVKDCQKALAEAEQKVQILTEKSGVDTLEPFDDENDFEENDD